MEASPWVDASVAVAGGVGVKAGRLVAGRGVGDGGSESLPGDVGGRLAVAAIGDSVGLDGIGKTGAAPWHADKSQAVTASRARNPLNPTAI